MDFVRAITVPHDQFAILGGRYQIPRTVYSKNKSIENPFNDQMQDMGRCKGCPIHYTLVKGDIRGTPKIQFHFAIFLILKATNI